MGNGNVLRVVGRDARGRESIDLARAARFVREHATELGVGAALLGGAILGTLYHKRAVPTEPVNEFDLHMPLPVPAPVAPLPVPPPKVVAKVEISDEPVSGYRPQSPRSEADAGAPEGDILTAKASEAGQSDLDGLQAKLEAPLASASSDLEEAADLDFQGSFLDMINSMKAAAKKKTQADAAEIVAKGEQARREDDERAKRKPPSAAPQAMKPKAPKQKDDLTEWMRKKEQAEVDAYAYLGVTRGIEQYPSKKEIRDVKKAIKIKYAETHPDRKHDEGKALDETLDHYNVIRKGRMEYEDLPFAKEHADQRAEFLERQKRNEARQSFGRWRLYV